MLFFGAFVAATAIAAGAAERLQDGTATLVLTRPVGPLAWLLGGLLGAALALAQTGTLLGTVLLFAARNGPDRLHPGVVWPALAAVLAALAWGLRASLARRAFQPAALGAATILLPLAYLAGLAVGPTGRVGGALDAPDPVALAAAALATLAALTYAGLGLCLATRLPAAAASALTLVAFVLGSLVEAAASSTSSAPTLAVGGALLVLGWLWLVRVALADRLAWGAGVLLLPPAGAVYAALRWDRARAPALAALAGGALLLVAGRVPGAGLLALLVPDVQLFWVADAAYSHALVPLDYVLLAAGYAGLYVTGALGVGAWLLAGRELPT
jgi:hypothetical protein